MMPTQTVTPDFLSTTSTILASVLNVAPPDGKGRYNSKKCSPWTWLWPAKLGRNEGMERVTRPMMAMTGMEAKVGRAWKEGWDS